MPEFNRRFCVTPQITKSAFIPWIPGSIALDDILCIQDQRIVNNDNTISYKGKIFQIPSNEFRYSYRRTKVKVNEYLDGRIAIFHGPRKLIEFDNKHVGLWTSPTDRLAPYGMCGKADGQPWKTSCNTAFPHSLNSRPQGPQAQL